MFKGVRGRAALITTLCYLLVMVGISWVAFRNPRYKWDIVAYAAVALSYESSEPAAVQERAYGAVREVVSPALYEGLRGGVPYRADVARDPSAFFEQLPFYRTRVLYCRVVYLLYRAGMNPVRAELLVAVASYLALSILFLLWMQRHLSAPMAAAVSLLVCASGPCFQVARLCTPDATTALFVCAGIYLFLERGSVVGLFAMLALAITARSDAVLVGLLFSVQVFLFGGGQSWRMRALRGVASASAMLGTYAVLTWVYKPYGWAILFHHSFVRGLVHPAAAAAVVDPRDYVRALAEGVHVGITQGGLLPFLLVLALGAVFYWPVRGRPAVRDPLLAVPLVLLAHTVARTLLFPMPDDRFYLAHYLVFSAVAVTMLRRRGAGSPEAALQQ
jgi:hypothetical protein